MTSEKLKVFVVANTIMGDRHEPFLPYCLESIADAVDYLILNDNSGNPENPNIEILKASRIWKEGRAILLKSRLSELGGFHSARNMCLSETGNLTHVRNLGMDDDKNIWVLYLDCDEVHPESLKILTRNILPSLSKNIGVVDGYFFQFLQSFQYYGSIDHRHNLLFKYHPDIKWVEPIHSKLLNLQGKRLVMPYVYFHYGYVYSPENLYRRFKLYHEYGALPDLAPNGETLAEGLKNLIPITLTLKGKHPKAIRPFINELTQTMIGYIDNFEKAMESYNNSKSKRSLKSLKLLFKLLFKEKNFYFRLLFRQWGSALKLFPSLKGFSLMKKLWSDVF